MKPPIVLYLGPSMLDGAPIVVIATVGSVNVKTGAMIQTWIMRADAPPHEAGHAGLDASICGTCPRRRVTGGDCYVTIHQAPLSAWRYWERAGKPGENWADEGAILRLTSDARAHGLRLGSYGDPAAVPHGVWEDVIGALLPRSIVGYTHQWRAMTGRSALSWRSGWFRRTVMASCDTLQDATEARAAGWRYFLAVPASVPRDSIPSRTVECLATRDENPRTCATCGICDGAGVSPERTSVYLREHGALSFAKGRRSARLDARV